MNYASSSAIWWFTLVHLHFFHPLKGNHMTHPAISNSESMHCNKSVKVSLISPLAIPYQDGADVQGFVLNETSILTVINDPSLTIRFLNDIGVEKIVIVDTALKASYNIAIIKLQKPHGLPVPQLATSSIKRNDYVCFSNHEGYHRDGKVQSVLKFGNVLTVKTPSHQTENIGSPLFNRRREVVGMMLNPKDVSGHAVFCGLPTLQAAIKAAI